MTHQDAEEFGSAPNEPHDPQGRPVKSKSKIPTMNKQEMIEDIMTVIKANKDEEYVSAFQLADMIKEIVEKANE